MSKLRDTRKPLAYWNKMDALLEEYRSIDKTRELYRMDCERHPDTGPLDSFVNDGVKVFLDSVCYFYSRGDDLDRIREQSLMPAIQNSLFFMSEFAEHPERAEWKFLTDAGRNPSGTYEAYVFLAYCVCLDLDIDIMQKLSSVFAKPGEDRLVDLILRQYQPDRVTAKSAAQPKIFGELDKLIDATPKQRIKLIEKYLDHWAVQISKLKGMAMLGGVGGLRGAKSNADLDTEKFIKPSYTGWWAWEVALMVRVFGIDDSSFADHVLYPVDLARYRHRVKANRPPVTQAITDKLPADKTPVENQIPAKGFLGKLIHWFQQAHKEPELVNKLRDTRKPLEYWNKMDTSLEKYRSIERSHELYKMACERRPDGAPLLSLFDRGVGVFLDSICYFYSRGDSLDRIREQSLMPAIQNSLFFQAELAKHPKRAGGWEYLTHVGKNACGAYEAYVFLAYCVCLDLDIDTMQKLSPVFAKAGEDRLVDLILRQYQPNRVIAKSAAQPKIFGELDKLIDATPEQRVKLIEKYLDRWAVLISKLKGLAMLGGVGGLEGAKSNADLDTEKFIKPSYSGWWAWEVALMVRVFGIDDSSFADHVLYPVDLARYRHEGSDNGLWPMMQADELWPIRQLPDKKNTAAKGLAGKPRIDELQLAIVLNLPADTPASKRVDANALIGDDPAREERHYLYLAVDEDTKVLQEKPMMVAAEASTLIFEIYYSSDNNAIKFGQSMIDQISKNLQASSGYGEFLPLRKDLQDADPAELMETFSVDWQQGLTLPIATGENWAAWINTIQPRPGGHFVFAVVFKQITPQNTLLEVRGAFNRRQDLTIGEVVDFWEPLVKKYAGIKW